MFDVPAAVGFCGEVCGNGNVMVWYSHRAGIFLSVTDTFMLSSSSLSHSLRDFSSFRTLNLSRERPS